MKNRIVICDKIHNKGHKILEEAKDIEFLDASDIDKVELLNVISDADIIITRSSTPVNETLLNACNNLKAIVRAGVGVDNVDIDGCSKRGIIVMNVPTANTIAAVELTMAHMLSCMREFPYAHNQLKNDRIWKRENWVGYELNAKRLGVIGFGNIGSRVSIRAKAMGMDVVTYDPYINSTKATNLDVEYTTNFDDILACDVITIHTPKNEETINMIDSAEIAKMKDGVVLINCARGGLYNEEALYDALKSKKVRFAGIDVFVDEPAHTNKLLDLDNITVTPHLGANTYESQEKIATEAASQALEAIRGISYPNALNLPTSSNTPDFVEPYIELSQKLSFFGANLLKGVITSIQITVSGEIKEHIDAFESSVIVGALSKAFSDSVNYVNAAFLANEKGIKVEKIAQNNAKPYDSKVSVKITTESDAIEISGVIFNDSIARIVSINNFMLDIEPKGRMILFKNSDVPGVIGKLGNTLAKHGINISDFRLGRDTHERALAVIVVDEDINQTILNELGDLEECIKVYYASI